jgi:hypothetical protein
MAYSNETWGERDARRWRRGITVSLVASAVLGILWLAFGIGGNLLFFSLAMLFLLVIGIVVPVVIIGLGALVIQQLRRISRFLS